MKKTLIILTVLLVAAFAVFAATDYTQDVIIESEITPVEDFEFNLGYGSALGSYTYLNQNEDGNSYTYESGTSQVFDAAATQTAYFDVKQGAKLNLDGTPVSTSIALNVKVTDWLLAGKSYETASANQRNNITLTTDLDDNATDDDLTHNVVISGGTVTTATDDTSTTVNLAYTQGVTAENTALFKFQADWAANVNLAAGIYTSTVTLSYTAN